MVHYISFRVNYTEPLFVVVIMTLAATRPILRLSETIIRKIARLLGRIVDRPVADRPDHWAVAGFVYHRAGRHDHFRPGAGPHFL